MCARRLAISSLLTAVIAPVLAAQAPVPEAGARVRVVLPEETRQIAAPMRGQSVRGILQEYRSDTLLLGVPPATGELAIPFSAVRALAISRGTPGRLESGLRGLIPGAIQGALFGLIVQGYSGDFLETDKAGEAALAGAAIGAGVGFVVDFVWPRERWRRAALPSR